MKPFKYILALILTTTFVVTVSAQKVKLKKNQVLVDGVAIAKYESKGNYYTVFTDLKDPKKIINAKYTAYNKPGSKSRYQWVTFLNADETLQSDVKLEDLIFSLNFRKGLAETMLKKFNMLTMDGINMEAFNTFMEVERPNLMDQYSGKNVSTVSKEVNEESAIIDPNIYGKNGVLITGDNEVVKGVITMIFDDDAFQATGKTVLKYNPEEEGQYVRILGKKEGGENSFYGAKAHSKARFCVEVASGENECYYGMELKGSGVIGAVFDTAAFHKILKKKESLVILEDYESGGYAIKIPSQYKGFLFNTNNPEKNIKKLSEYLDCDVSEFKDNNFKEIETAEAIVDFYLANCGKK